METTCACIRYDRNFLLAEHTDEWRRDTVEGSRLLLKDQKESRRCGIQ